MLRLLMRHLGKWDWCVTDYIWLVFAVTSRLLFFMKFVLGHVRLDQVTVFGYIRHEGQDYVPVFSSVKSS